MTKLKRIISSRFSHLQNNFIPQAKIKLLHVHLQNGTFLRNPDRLILQQGFREVLSGNHPPPCKTALIAWVALREWQRLQNLSCAIITDPKLTLPKSCPSEPPDTRFKKPLYKICWFYSIVQEKSPAVKQSQKYRKV